MNTTPPPHKSKLYLIGLTLFIGLYLFAGCDTIGTKNNDHEDVGAQERDASLVSNRTSRVQDSLTTALLFHEEIVGLASSISESGQESIVVLVKTPVGMWPAQKKNIVPPAVSGIPVTVIVTGEIIAPILMRGAGAMLGAQAFERPVPIGVSAGLANGLTGTLGARVTDGTATYALSNNHVFASMNNGLVGNSVIQPGKFDGGTESQHTFATLTDFEPIDFSGQCVNTIDAAIAFAGADQLQNGTPSIGYGVPWSTPIAATPGMNVQKFGRTSGLTFGSVIALNATVEVGYGNAGIACFKNQIIVSPGEFSLGGDSGSLVVASSNDNSVNTRPVGLVFAGSQTISVANDIRLVLDRFGVEVDGREGPSSGNHGNGNNGNGNNNGNNGNGNGNGNGNNSNGNGNGGNNGNGNSGNGNNNGGPITAQNSGEIYIRVQDSNGELVEDVQICFYTTASSSACETSLDHLIDGTLTNFGIEIDGDACGTCNLVLSNYTHYIGTTANSVNQLYFYREVGDHDAYVTLTVGSTDIFSIDDAPLMDMAVVEKYINNVQIETPRWTGSELEITWGLKWNPDVASFFPNDANATVKIKDGATLTTNGYQDEGTGSGSFDWTPTQEYPSIQIQVYDNDSGIYGLSSVFSVVNPPLTGFISGTSYLEESVQGTWTASATGGINGYTYQWDFLWICNEQSIGIQVEECDTWQPGGSGSTWSKTVYGDFFDMKIRLTVTDSDSPANQSYTYLIVDIYEP